MYFFPPLGAVVVDLSFQSFKWMIPAIEVVVAGLVASIVLPHAPVLPGSGFPHANPTIRPGLLTEKNFRPNVDEIEVSTRKFINTNACIQLPRNIY